MLSPWRRMRYQNITWPFIDGHPCLNYSNQKKRSIIFPTKSAYRLDVDSELKQRKKNIPDTESELWPNKWSNASSIHQGRAGKEPVLTSTDDHGRPTMDGRTRQKRSTSNYPDHCNYNFTLILGYTLFEIYS